MPLSLVCGAECQIKSVGGGATYSDSHWGVLLGTPAVVTSPVRSGAYAYDFVNPVVPGAFLEHYFPSAQQASIYFRGYFRMGDATPAGTATIMRFDRSAGGGLGLMVSTVGVVSIAMGPTSSYADVQSSTNNFTAANDTWYGVEIEAEFSQPWAARWRYWTELDGWSASEEIGVNSGDTSIAGVQIGWPHGGTTGDHVYWDDLAIGYSTAWGDIYDPTDTNGVDGYVLRYSPNADGTHGFSAAGDFRYQPGTIDVALGATDTWQWVDDADMESTTEYIERSGGSATEYLTNAFSDEASYDTPRGVSVVSHQDPPSSSSMAVYLSDDGSTWSLVTPSRTVSNTVDCWLQDMVATAPSGGAWTRAKINSTQARWGYIDTSVGMDALALEVEWTVGYPPPKFETVTLGSAGGAASLTIDKPSGTGEGELLVAFVEADGDTGEWDQAPSGWTLVESKTGTISEFAVLWKIAGASEGTSYTFTKTGVEDLNGAILRISGASLDAPIAASVSYVMDSTTAPDPPASGTVSIGQYLAIAAIAGRATNTTSSTPPTNYTERVDRDVNGAFLAVATRELWIVTSEDPGAFTTNEDDFAMFTILIKPNLAPIVYVVINPTDDITTTGWTSTPLWSKVDEDPASPDATIITATAS